MITAENKNRRYNLLKDSVTELLDKWFYSLRELARELWTYPKKVKDIQAGRVTKVTEINSFISKLWLK